MRVGDSSGTMKSKKPTWQLQKCWIVPVFSLLFLLWSSAVIYLVFAKLALFEDKPEAEEIPSVEGYTDLPRWVTNLTCISHNWENFKCTWTEPRNLLKTRYKMVYRPRDSKKISECDCPIQRDETTENSSCVWDFTTNPQYQRNYEYYDLKMLARNEYRSRRFSYSMFHHYANVIPASPTELTYTSFAGNFVHLAWEIPRSMQHFPPGLVHKLRFRSDRADPAHGWHEGGQLLLPAAELNCQTKLKLTTSSSDRILADTVYHVEVSIRSAAAKDKPDMWSAPARLSFRTPAEDTSTTNAPRPTAMNTSTDSSATNASATMNASTTKNSPTTTKASTSTTNVPAKINAPTTTNASTT